MSEVKTRKPRTPKVKEVAKIRPALPRKENGLLDWRKVVDQNHLFLNPHYFASKGIGIEDKSPEEIEELEASAPDEAWLIKLQGWNQLAEARGVKEIRYAVQYRDHETSVVYCEMKLFPNEEEKEEVVISGIGTAGFQSVTADFLPFMDTIGSNRAKIKALRSYFGIESLGSDELNPNEKVQVKSPPNLYKMLEEVMKEKGIETSDLRSLMLEKENKEIHPKWGQEGNSDETPIEDRVGFISDLYAAEVLSILGILKNSSV